MDLSIIIVNYNVKYFLEQCLLSVQKASKNIKAEIFVVDNYSTDGSRDWLESKFPSVFFTWNKVNEGFAKANNQVLPNAKGKFVLFLNPDTILPEDCLEKCLSFFTVRESCGAMGVRMIDGSGNFLRESKRSFPSASASFFKMTGLARLFPVSAIFAKYYAGHLPEDQVNEVDVLAGAFLMVDRKLLEKVKGFDEDYFMYGEDIDLAYRIQQEGFKNFYFPETTIIHFKGESTQKLSKRYIDNFYGAMQLFIKKHYKKNVTRFMLGIAISIGKLFSLVKMTFVKLFFNSRPNAGNLDIMVVAGQVYFNEMIQLIKYSKIPLIIQGRVTVDKTDLDSAMGNVENMEEIITKNKTDKIIFCEEPLTFNAMISQMQLLKNKTGFLFHAKNSRSIIGSDNKNEQGIFIAP